MTAMHENHFLPVIGLMSLLMTACGEKSAPSTADAGPTPPKAQATVAPPETAKPTAPAAEESWIPADGLGDWKVLETAGAAKVEVKGGELLIGAGEGVTGVRYDGKKEIPVVDYELAWEAKKTSGVDFFGAATFPVRDVKTCATFINGGWGGGVTGISCLDGSSANDNKTCSTIFYDENRWYKFRVQVGAEVLQAWVDDKRVVNCTIKGVEVGLRPGDIEGCAPLGFATWMTKAAIRNVIIKKLPAGSVKPDADAY